MFYAKKILNQDHHPALSPAQEEAVGKALAKNMGYLPTRVVQEILASWDITIEQLMMRLVPVAMRCAITPISGFPVGATALGSSGSLYLGANIEFVGQALSMSVHAEQAATANAISHKERGLSMLAVSAAPCGYCRQFLFEIATASTLEILLPKDEDSSQDSKIKLAELLPHAFGPADLQVSAALMTPQNNKLSLESPAKSLTTTEALSAANASYSPYSKSYAGVALKTASGAIFSGSYAENAAYNPSMSPLEVALVSLVFGGASTKDIVEAVLVEVDDAKVSQREATQDVLSSISTVTLQVVEAQSPSSDGA
ncbi:MAG TPA: cytidine deaminase [Thioalkalivibrio sp.]|nr:cytidine deaminase [Thioalkalivibrio sp.]